MKHRTTILLFALVSMFVVAPVFGNDDAALKGGSGSCNLDGSWFALASSGFGPFTLNVAMTSHHKGIASIVFTGFEPTVFGLCPNSVQGSIGQGAVTRTGLRSFDYTIISFTQDAFGQVECIGHSIGWAELDPGCDFGRMNGHIELYYGADKNPFGDDTPAIVLPDTPEDYPMVRMTIE